MRKWYNVELNEDDATKLRIFLHNNSINYEASAAYNLIHFEIELSNADFDIVQNFIEKM